MKQSLLVLDVAKQVGGTQPSTTVLRDWSREKNHGAMTAVTWSRLPSGLWVMGFDGGTSEISCADSNSLRLTTGLTIELWSYWEVGAAFAIIVEKGAGTSGYNIYADESTDTLHFHSYTPGSTDDSLGALTHDVWQHIVVTYDGADKVGYINTISTIVARVGTLSTAATALTIGRRAGALIFTGSQALVRIYSYALTPAAIRASFARNKHFFGVN